MNSKNVKVIAASAWKDAQGGTVKHRIVTWEMDERAGPEFMNKGQRAEYASHMECDLENGSALYFHEGHYNLTFGESAVDFVARCNRSKIAPYPVIQPSTDGTLRLHCEHCGHDEVAQPSARGIYGSAVDYCTACDKPR